MVIVCKEKPFFYYIISILHLHTLTTLHTLTHCIYNCYIISCIIIYMKKKIKLEKNVFVLRREGNSYYIVVDGTAYEDKIFCGEKWARKKV